MVCFTPAEDFDPRSPEELYDDFNRVMPFPIDTGDFVAKVGMKGPKCWVCFEDDGRIRKLINVLESTHDWTLSSIGSVRKDSRAMFGLSARPGVYDKANIKRMLAQNRDESERL